MEEKVHDCIFCRIIAGEIPAEIVYEDDTVVAFRDLYPVAPTHVLIVPRFHTETILDLAKTEDVDDTMARVMFAVSRIAKSEGIAENGFRFIANTGRDGGQTIFHTHFHLIGGAPLGEALLPPGSIKAPDDHPLSQVPSKGNDPVKPIVLPDPPGIAHL
ncbi:MAG TPA: histidine triad nucleotide-binding protein [Fastidiosipila sp.]|nr:histidine triad nucleotide-binding protein [Fastidiosipila sp.]